MIRNKVMFVKRDLTNYLEENDFFEFLHTKKHLFAIKIHTNCNFFGGFFL